MASRTKPISSLNLESVDKGLSTNDKDLVQLAGYHAYQKYEKPLRIDVNGKEFEVINTLYDAPSGLDAFTVQNKETDELTVVFVGSEQLVEDWIATNPKLLSSTEPAQLKDAKAYFDDVNKTYGKVSHVTGNSLAGASTNAVGIENPDVKAVTLNPALLPEGSVDPHQSYPNITNYYSRYDALTRTQHALAFDHRIPGEKHIINHGIPTFSLIGPNHTGYVTPDEQGRFRVPIGIEGEPGYGFINIGADDHIVTSLWNGAPLHGGSAEKIKINQTHMYQLADGIKSQVQERLHLAGNYLENATAIVQHERDLFHRRVITLQKRFQTMLNELAGEPMLQGLATTGNRIKSCIDDLIRLLDQVEERCRLLNHLLNSMPAELIQYASFRNIDMESLFSPARQYLENIKRDIDHLILRLQRVTDRDIPALFRGGAELFVDAVTGELLAHYTVVRDIKDHLLEQIDDYEQGIRHIAQSFHDLDHRLAGETPSEPLMNSVPTTEVRIQATTIGPYPYLQRKMKIKEAQVERAYGEIKKLSLISIVPLLDRIGRDLWLLETTMKSSMVSIDAVTFIALYGSPSAAIRTIFTNYEYRVKELARGVKLTLSEIIPMVEGPRRGVQQMANGFPQMLNEFKPYIDTAIFESHRYTNVRLYNIAASHILDDMELIFRDIIFQLSDERGKAVQAALELSHDVKDNMSYLNELVKRGTVE